MKRSKFKLEAKRKSLKQTLLLDNFKVDVWNKMAIQYKIRLFGIFLRSLFPIIFMIEAYSTIMLTQDFECY